MLTERQIHIIQESWKEVLPISDQAGALFYEKLFELAPGVRELFAKDINPQASKLMAMLNAVVNNLDALEDIANDVGALGVRHDAYGATSEHYPVVGQALLATLKEELQTKWNDELEVAWSDAYEIVSTIMVGKPVKIGREKEFQEL
ncbi:MAG: hypothetical protein JKY52_18520 [Flavobacteriales bacterium]|nr:hypothetical protein [Flavobacteriales bacterium]